MLRFENIEFLYGLLILIPIVALYLLYSKLWKKSLRSFVEERLAFRTAPDYSPYKKPIKFSLRILALAFLILGLANLQVGSKMEKVERKGIDVVIALDVSNSMKAEDVKPSRLAKAKRAISNLIDKMRDDRIGLIGFAGDAYLQLPITTDYAAAKLFLDALNPSVVPKQGTAIGSSIKLALRSFPKNDGLKKAIIVITDGENHEDDAVEAAAEADKQGVKVYCVGVGSVEGAPIPVYRNGRQVDFLRDNQGSVVLTKMNPSLIESVAAAGGGKAVIVNSGDFKLDKIIDEISGIEKKKYGEKIFADYDDQFQYFFAIALVLILTDSLIGNKKNKAISNLDLFGGRK